MTVTDIRTRHSWDKKPRRDWPEHHIYTCRRDTCGLKKRHELVDGVWIWVWRWPDGEEGSGVTQPSCGERVAPALPEGGTDPAPVPPSGVASTVQAPTAETCMVCTPPCKREAHPRLGVPSCSEGVAAVSAARDRYWAESILGVRGGAA